MIHGTMSLKMFATSCCFAIVLLALCESSFASDLTKEPCPRTPSKVWLDPEVDSDGRGYLKCTIYIIPGVDLTFTIQIEGISKWSINTREQSILVPIADVGTSLLNKQITCLSSAYQTGPGRQPCWENLSSPVLIPKVKCPSQVNSEVEVVEGKGEEALRITSTVPPAFLCPLGDDGSCQVQVLTEVEVVGRELMCSAEEVIPQFVLGTELVDDGPNRICGQTLNNNNWMSGVTIPIKATVDGVGDGDNVRKVKLTVRITGQTSNDIFLSCGQVSVKAVNAYPMATCTSAYSSHTTFDGIRYRNRVPGEYVLYQQKLFPYEVRVMVDFCKKNTGSSRTCICGAAVKSRDDVITFNSPCSSMPTVNQEDSGLDVQVFQNGNLTKGTKIFRLDYVYEVILPTGSKVTISLGMSPDLQIDIHGVERDFDQVAGLCGNFNGRVEDDLEGASSSDPEAFIQIWKQTESIFGGVPASLDIVPSTPAPALDFCSCLEDKAPICRPGLDTYTCFQSNAVDITQTIGMPTAVTTSFIELSLDIPNVDPTVFDPESSSARDLSNTVADIVLQSGQDVVGKQLHSVEVINIRSGSVIFDLAVVTTDGGTSDIDAQSSVVTQVTQSLETADFSPTNGTYIAASVSKLEQSLPEAEDSPPDETSPKPDQPSLTTANSPTDGGDSGTSDNEPGQFLPIDDNSDVQEVDSGEDSFIKPGGIPGPNIEHSSGPTFKFDSAEGGTTLCSMNAPKNVWLIPELNEDGSGNLKCNISNDVNAGIGIDFTIQIATLRNVTGRSQERFISIPIKTINIDLLDKEIKCTVRLYQTDGSRQVCWERTSPGLTPTIEYLGTSAEVEVVEGTAGESMLIKSNVPPVFLCPRGDSHNCQVQIVTEVEVAQDGELTCSDVEFIPQLVLGTELLDNGPNKICGKNLDNSNWQSGVSIPVKATVDGVIDGDNVHEVKITARISRQEDSNLDIEKLCGRVPFKANNLDKKATCGSINDPHIYTFDGMHYHNFEHGEFVLYRHKDLPYEVRALYWDCYPRKTVVPTCNCGAAIKSGDDLITFSTCFSTNGFIEVKKYLNGALTPGTEIHCIGTSGKRYEVILPTGTKIEITASFSDFINIHIHGATPDFDEVEGLCGNFNGDAADDLDGEPLELNGYANSFSMKWRIKIDEQTFFEEECLPAANPTFSPPTYCSCLEDVSPVCSPGHGIYKCSQSNTQDNCTDKIEEISCPIMGQHGRRKRSVDEQDAVPTAMPSEMDIGSVYNETTAEAYCRSYLESKTSVKACESYLDQTAVERSVASCTVDLVALGEKEWADSHLEDLIIQCLEFAKQEESAWKNSTEETRVAGEPVLPEVIKSGLCEKDCGEGEERGSCLNGVCDCNAGFSGELCEVSKETIPEVLPATSPCDILTSDCNKTIIYGYNFVRSPDLTCHYQFVTADTSVELTSRVGEKEVVPAAFVSMHQIVCYLPISINSAKAHGAFVKISNNGIQQSTASHLHLAFKSSCQDCMLTTDGLNVLCIWRSRLCVIEGQCYDALMRSDSDPCYICDPDVSADSWTKSSDPECSIVKVESSSSDFDLDIMIIVVVVASVVLVVAVAVCIVVRRRRQKTTERATYTVQPGQIQNFYQEGLPTVTNHKKLTKV